MRIFAALLAVAAMLAIVLTSPGDERFRTEDVSFTSDYDGTTQRYVRMLPKGFRPETKHHVLIALHGHGSDRWQFASGTTPTGVATRNAAAERGMILILPDYRAGRFQKGDTIRTDRYRLTVYAGGKGVPIGRMLYDHQNDPDENVNIAELPANAELVERLTRQLQAGMGKPTPAGKPNKS